MSSRKDVAVLVVDDDAGLRKALIFDLKNRGYKAIGSSNHQDAWEIVKSKTVDIVLSDVRLPNGDGMKLLNNIKKSHPDLPVLMFAVGIADNCTEAACARAAQGVFIKLFDRTPLLDAVERILEQRRESQRIPVEWEVDISFPEMNYSVRTKVLNISRGGCFIALTEQLPPLTSETAFSIRFSDDGHGVIDGRGVVRWIRSADQIDASPGCGIEFLHLDEASRSHIERLYRS